MTVCENEVTGDVCRYWLIFIALKHLFLGGLFTIDLFGISVKRQKKV